MKCNKYLILGILAILILLCGAYLSLRYQQAHAPFNSPVAIPSISPVMTELKDVSTPDGTKTISMKVINNPDNSNTYTFVVTDNKGGKIDLFGKTLLKEKSMSLSPNAWSPDNKLVFIQENDGKKITGIDVFNGSGQPFSNGDRYINVIPLYDTHVTTHNFKEATGWAAETLIIINTTESDGSRWPILLV